MSINNHAQASSLPTARSWTELRPLIRAYQQSIAAHNAPARFFGYGSLIHNHADIKSDSELPNERVEFNGYELAMNVYASGLFGLRGMVNPELGVANTGLYVGMEAVPNTSTDGMNITVTADAFPKALEAYARRELGEPPYPEYFSDIFSDKPLDELPTIAKDKDSLGLYQLIAGTTVDHQGNIQLALTVATNEQSPLAAIGLTPMQAAYYILTGVGIQRPSANGQTMLGGASLDYFQNLMKTYHDGGYDHPRMEATANAVNQLFSIISETHHAISCYEDLLRNLENNKALAAAETLIRMTIGKILEPTAAIQPVILDPLIGENRVRPAEEIVTDGLQLIPRTPEETLLRLVWLSSVNSQAKNAEQPEFQGPFADACDGLLRLAATANPSTNTRMVP